MCFGCPKWCIVATWSFAIFVFLGGITYYITLHSLTKKIIEQAQRAGKANKQNPYVNNTALPIVDHKSTDKCIIIQGQRKTNLRAGGFIHTEFELTCKGTIRGKTTLWPESSFFGLLSGDFTGCVEVYLYGREAQLWASDQHKFATSPKNESTMD
uniref:Uncharacterized protein n=1 Tax=Ditylenchus dipsaci TaxID=166011 RepID=A0A915DN56_9BILA